MHRITFFNLGNADSWRVDLDNGKKVLFDYAAMCDPDDDDDKRIDLREELLTDLKNSKKGGFEIVAFTHLDDDHTHGADEFFHLDHNKKYQSDDRAIIETLWVPAGVITESRNNLEVGAKAIQAEARYRLEKGERIRVFSRPEALKDWLEGKGLTLKSREHLITDAGQVAPELNLEKDGVEFFIHSPFGWRQDDGTVEDRNRDSLVTQATFVIDEEETRLILGSDVDYEALSDIVTVTRKHRRDSRLEWDIFKLPHHCSYKSLGPELGVDKTEPVDEVDWLFKVQGQIRCITISSSNPIPTKGSKEDDSVQPPHRQAAAYYNEVAEVKDGEFIVTMEFPSTDQPEPIEIEISGHGAKTRKKQVGGAAAIISTTAPRAG